MFKLGLTTATRGRGQHRKEGKVTHFQSLISNLEIYYLLCAVSFSQTNATSVNVHPLRQTLEETYEKRAVYSPNFAVELEQI